MIRTILWLIGGLMLGGIIHIIAVILVPYFTTEDAWARVARFGPDAQFNVLPEVKPGAEPLPMLDPAMAHAVCRFSLDDGPIRLNATIPYTFWSFSLFNERGETTYSFNDRTSGEGKLAMLALTSSQLSMLRENPPDDLESLIVIETEDNHAFALLRAFIPDKRREKDIDAALAKAKCTLLKI
ncbi:hypothetical protein [Breoghania sp.]|uniref:DUF1254 domain-containing protein n=1 Tax=Breoghania sp. TaxID=2065378 RepID=UPI00260B2396|nr:hypothetical protein [Breoghania sp.]MDJ0931812.1 hypothetical protein [Breoghania sp.]